MDAKPAVAPDTSPATPAAMGRSSVASWMAATASRQPGLTLPLTSSGLKMFRDRDYFAGGGGGRSLLKMSVAMRQTPPERFQTSTYFPRSSKAAPAGDLPEMV